MKACTIFRTLIILFCLFNCYQVKSQSKYSPKYLREDDKSFKALAKEMTPEGWIRFNEKSNIKRTDFFEKFGKNIGISKGYEMKKVRDVQMDGIRHETYQLFLNGIIVEGIQYSLHSQKELVHLARGKMVENLQIDNSKALKETDLFDLTVKELKEKPEKYKKNKPKGELVVMRENADDFDANNFKLAYKFPMIVGDSSLAEHREIYTDATTGKVIDSKQTRHGCFSNSHKSDRLVYSNTNNLQYPPPLLNSSDCCFSFFL